MPFTDKEKFIEEIFSKRESFEEYILEVTSDTDRVEIMEILSRRIIDILLREELNFLYMKNFDSFKFSLIVNLLFKEIANEWVYFAQEKFLFTKDEALDEIQNKKRVLFLLAIVKWYFTNYKIYFTDKIADNFIRLVELSPNITYNNEIIKIVLSSTLLKNKNISAVHNYTQLYNRVKDARNSKNDKLAQLQFKISEFYSHLDEENSTEVSENKIKEKIKKYEKEVEKIEETPVCLFNDAVRRVRDTLSANLLTIESFPTL